VKVEKEAVVDFVDEEAEVVEEVTEVVVVEEKEAEVEKMKKEAGFQLPSWVVS